MQNRQNSNIKIEYMHFDLPLDFPIFNVPGEKYVMSDKDVTMLHYHNCMEIGYCCEGNGIYFIDDKVIPFSKGDVSVIFKNQIHIGQSEKNRLSKWQFLLLNPDQFLINANIHDISLISDMRNRRSGFINILNQEKYPYISLLVQQIVHELEKQDELYKLSVQGLILNLIANLKRILLSTADKDVILDTDSLMRVAPALNHISKNYMYSLRITDLAKLCNCSVTNFRRLFQMALNNAPIDYISRVRIQMAALLLKNTNYTVIKIAEQVGYDTLSCFNRQFKKILGISPRTWRNAKE